MAKTKEKKPGLLEGVGDFLGGAADFITHPLQRGVAKTEQVKLQNEKIKAFTESQKIRNLIAKMKLEQGQSEFTDAAVKLGKIAKARESFANTPDGLDPEIAAFFDATEQSVVAKTGFRVPDINLKTGKPRQIFDATPGGGKLIGTRNKDGSVTTPSGKVVVDHRELFSAGVDVFDDGTGKAKGKPVAKTPAEDVDMSKFIQSATLDFPEDTTPKTLPELGITTPDVQQKFEELEAQLPKLDLRQAYQVSPADFQKILKALMVGKTPNGKPFTMKDAIKLITENI